MNKKICQKYQYIGMLLLVLITIFELSLNKITVLSPNELAIKFEGRHNLITFFNFFTGKSISAKFSMYGNIQREISTVTIYIYRCNIYK